MSPIDIGKRFPMAGEVNNKSMASSEVPGQSDLVLLEQAELAPWCQYSSNCNVAVFNGVRKARSIFTSLTEEALSCSSMSGSSSDSLIEELAAEAPSYGFGLVMREHTINGSVHFNGSTRKGMEPYLRQARLLREMARSRTDFQVDAAIAGSVGVPYTCLRQERPFLFDEHTHPLHDILAKALNVSELSLAHEVINDDELLKPLLYRENRHAFHCAYDNFVTTFCLPLLHSVAIAKNLFHWASPSDSVTYRYQAFPTIRIARPGCPAEPPQCGLSRGHSIGCIFFHIPLTPSIGDSSLFVESYPGKEDWHPLQAKSVGLGYMYDGARCLQFSLENTSSRTRVSLEFCVLLYREPPSHSSKNTSSTKLPRLCGSEYFGDLCLPEMLEDRFAAAGPGYYEEAVIDLGRVRRPGMAAVHRKTRSLIDPDYRFGYPFA